MKNFTKEQSEAAFAEVKAKHAQTPFKDGTARDAILVRHLRAAGCVERAERIEKRKAKAAPEAPPQPAAPIVQREIPPAAMAEARARLLATSPTAATLAAKLGHKPAKAAPAAVQPPRDAGHLASIERLSKCSERAAAVLAGWAAAGYIRLLPNGHYRLSTQTA